MEDYTNLVDAISALKKQGYTEDFNLKDNCLICGKGNIEVFHSEFEIDKSFRFEGDSTPDDQSIIYAISSDKHNVKGLLVNAYSIYSDDYSNEILGKLKRHGN